MFEIATYCYVPVVRAFERFLFYGMFDVKERFR